MLVRLADRADNEGSEAYPSVNSLVRDCGLSRRSVQRSLRSLVQAGYLVIARKATPTTPVVYRVTLESQRSIARGATMTPRARETPDASQSQRGCQDGTLTIKEPPKNSLSRRARSLDDFELDDHDREWAAKHAPDVDPHRVLEELRAYCASTGKTYSDYRAAWQSFCLRQQDDRHGTGRQSTRLNGKVTIKEPVSREDTHSAIGATARIMADRA